MGEMLRHHKISSTAIAGSETSAGVVEAVSAAGADDSSMSILLAADITFGILKEMVRTWSSVAGGLAAAAGDFSADFLGAAAAGARSDWTWAEVEAAGAWAGVGNGAGT